MSYILPLLTDRIPGAPRFTFGDVVRSATAKSRGIDNTPSDASIWQNATYLAQKCLQPARDYFNQAIIINSWYRCHDLNVAVGGSDSSFHSYGMAADIVFADRGGPKLIDLFNYFYKYGVYTELIAEEIGKTSGWIHIALARGREKENQLKYKAVGSVVQRMSYENIIVELTQE